MFVAWVVLASFSYAAILFALAWYGDRRPLYAQQPWLRPVIYSFALAVYCSSWTFYGAVGTAVRSGWGYVSIYLGPLILFIFFWRLIERLALVVQSQNTVSIADLISRRYGRSQRLASLVALIAVIAGVPYLALQYKAVTLSLNVLTGRELQQGLFGDPALYVAVIMALFSILFGTRQVDATEHRPGLMLAVAFESFIKLWALIAVGVFALFWANKHDYSVVHATQSLLSQPPARGFLTQTLLAFAAIVCLPRQFHVAVVECGDVSDVRQARWIFGSYLIIVSLMVLPIAVVGQAIFAGGGDEVAPDTYVLALPLSQGQIVLALAAYIGGFSAATGMVIVTSVALATMVSNDLVMPWFLRQGWVHQQGSVSSTVLWVRRIAILLVAAVAYGYYYGSRSDTVLAAYGLMAFVAVAQFAPGLIGGLYWQGASRQGVEAGLWVGFVVWIYTLLLPTLSEASWFDTAWIMHGPFGIEALRPYELFGLKGMDPLTHGTFWSLLLNVFTFLLVSAWRRPSLGELLHAEPFFTPYAKRRASGSMYEQNSVFVNDLLALAERVVGASKAKRAFRKQAQTMGIKLHQDLRADQEWLQFTELLLAAAVGAASARLVLTSALRGSGLEVAAIVSLLDQAGPELRFNREILLATLDNLDQGISVVDADMRLVAWNQRYQQMFNYPPGMLYVGRHVADLIRFNAERGKIPYERPEDIEKAVQKRINYMRAGTSHVFQRTINNNAQVIELRGRPLPGGGYVTSYNDITEFQRVEAELLEINETLEQRVAARTKEARRAQESRTLFLTAVSHDVLQPINAARLFAAALYGANDMDEMRRLAERVDTSLRAAEELLDGLLDISQLDTGALKPDKTVFAVTPFLDKLKEQYMPIARRRQLEMRFYSRNVLVHSDKRLLRRVLQNFISNALRYTVQGRIVVGVRIRARREVEFQVWDTGQGIPEHHLEQIFDEFRRYEQRHVWGERGLGLGLSICQRISNLLEHRLSARSEVGKGSMFSIRVPLATEHATLPLTVTERPFSMDLNRQLKGLKVLCLDNDVEILFGVKTLLSQWGVEVITASTVDEALEKMNEQPHVLLVDYHLHDRLNGLDSLDLLRRDAKHIHGALFTADGSDEVKRDARERGYLVLTKPVKPASLRAFLAAQYKH